MLDGEATNKFLIMEGLMKMLMSRYCNQLRDQLLMTIYFEPNVLSWELANLINEIQ